MISAVDSRSRVHFRFEWIGNGVATNQRIRVVTD